MENPFEELEDTGQTPSPKLKTRILGSYGLLSNVAKTAELFMSNFAYTLAEVVKLFDKQLNANNDDTFQKPKK